MGGVTGRDPAGECEDAGDGWTSVASVLWLALAMKVNSVSSTLSRVCSLEFPADGMMGCSTGVNVGRGVETMELGLLLSKNGSGTGVVSGLLLLSTSATASTVVLRVTSLSLVSEMKTSLANDRIKNIKRKEIKFVDSSYKWFPQVKEDKIVSTWV